MESMEEIAILNREARRRGTSYGKLVARLSWADRKKLLKDAEREQKQKKRRRG